MVKRYYEIICAVMLIGVSMLGNAKEVHYTYGTETKSYWYKPGNKKWLSGDFNGDGLSDIAYVWNDNGLATIYVYINQSQALSAIRFNQECWATAQGGYWESQKWFAGDFNGDGRDDLAKVFNDHSFSDIDVHLSVLDSHFSLQHWAYKQGGFWDNQIWKPIDINGDGASDFINIFEENDNTLLDLHQSSGSNFPGYVNLECDINPLQYSRVLCWLEGNFLPDTEGQREVIGVYMNMSVPAPFINFVIFSFD